MCLVQPNRNDDRYITVKVKRSPSEVGAVVWNFQGERERDHILKWVIKEEGHIGKGLSDLEPTRTKGMPLKFSAQTRGYEENRRGWDNDKG